MQPALRSALAALVALVAWIALPVTPVFADAAGPTDYQSEIVEIDPATPALHPSIVGGDAFLLLRVDGGSTVEVLGYRSEPFLRFLADGTVVENRASATWYLRGSRLGGALPEGFDEDADPDWHTVAHDGEYAWHDHRTHWMSTSRPPGKRPGDVVLQQDIPVLVDGAPVSIVVQSTWIPAPSSVPGWLGGVVGAVAGAVLWVGRRWRWRGLPVLDVAILATAIGAWQYASLPSETGPRPLWFVLPAVAMVAMASWSVLARARSTTAALAAHALLLLAGVDLVVWGWMRRDGMVRPVLPTDAPAWLDRAVSAAGLATGIAVTALGAWGLVQAIVAPQRVLPTSSAT